MYTVQGLCINPFTTSELLRMCNICLIPLKHYHISSTFTKTVCRISNSLDPDETPSYSTSHLGPDCLQMLLYTVLNISKLKKITATEPQPNQTVLNYFAIFKNVAHSLEPGETPSYSASHQAPNYVQRS